jgi:peptidoglycan/LPS O-acetylase OafA/YrhL
VKRSQALDAVRGIAIILVLIWHYVPRVHETPDLLVDSIRLFWSGVDLFFVLSGFLIGGILLQNVNSKNYFSTFYIRRASRILPLYLLIFLAFILVIYLSAESLATTTVRHLPLWSYLTFTQNFLYAARERLNDPWMDVTWSLAVEEQFYIFLSVLIKNLSKTKLSILTISLIILAPILRFYAPNTMVAYILPFQRADSLMLGVLLALIWQWDKGKEFLCKNASVFRWSIAIFLLGAVYLTYQDVGVGSPYSHFWLALLYGNFIVLGLTLNPDPGKFSVFKSRILEWFGLRSYGIYLLHKPVQLLIPFILAWFLHNALSPWIVAIISLIALFIVSELSYRIVEKPVMSLGHYFKYE